MRTSPRLAYVQARIQARYGARPDPSDWASLEQIQGFGHYVQQAAGQGLGKWLEKLGLNSDSHAVEISLRQAFRQTVAEICAWMPLEWHAATGWCALLVDLEPIRIIASGDPVPDWFHDDPFLGPLASEPGSWPLPDLGTLDQGGQPLAQRWQALWTRYLPAMAPRDRGRLDALREQLPMSAYDRAVIAKLDRSFRAFAGTPVAVFSFLGLALSDLLRLRGELLRRIEFDGRVH